MNKKMEGKASTTAATQWMKQTLTVRDALAWFPYSGILSDWG